MNRVNDCRELPACVRLPACARLPALAAVTHDVLCVGAQQDTLVLQQADEGVKHGGLVLGREQLRGQGEEGRLRFPELLDVEDLFRFCQAVLGGQVRAGEETRGSGSEIGDTCKSQASARESEDGTLSRQSIAAVNKTRLQGAGGRQMPPERQ